MNRSGQKTPRKSLARCAELRPLYNLVLFATLILAALLIALPANANVCRVEPKGMPEEYRGHLPCPASMQFDRGVEALGLQQSCSDLIQKREQARNSYTKVMEAGTCYIGDAQSGGPGGQAQAYQFMRDMYRKQAELEAITIDGLTKNIKAMRGSVRTAADQLKKVEARLKHFQGQHAQLQAQIKSLQLAATGPLAGTPQAAQALAEIAKKQGFLVDVEKKIVVAEGTIEEFQQNIGRTQKMLSAMIGVRKKHQAMLASALQKVQETEQLIAGAATATNDDETTPPAAKVEPTPAPVVTKTNTGPDDGFRVDDSVTAGVDDFSEFGAGDFIPKTELGKFNAGHDAPVPTPTTRPTTTSVPKTTSTPTMRFGDDDFVGPPTIQDLERVGRQDVNPGIVKSPFKMDYTGTTPKNDAYFDPAFDDFAPSNNTYAPAGRPSQTGDVFNSDPQRGDTSFNVSGSDLANNGPLPSTTKSPDLGGVDFRDTPGFRGGVETNLAGNHTPDYATDLAANSPAPVTKPTVAPTNYDPLNPGNDHYVHEPVARPNSEYSGTDLADLASMDVASATTTNNGLAVAGDPRLGGLRGIDPQSVIDNGMADAPKVVRVGDNGGVTSPDVGGTFTDITYGNLVDGEPVDDEAGGIIADGAAAAKKLAALKSEIAVTRERNRLAAPAKRLNLLAGDVDASGLNFTGVSQFEPGASDLTLAQAGGSWDREETGSDSYYNGASRMPSNYGAVGSANSINEEELSEEEKAKLLSEKEAEQKILEAEMELAALGGDNSVVWSLNRFDRDRLRDKIDLEDDEDQLLRDELNLMSRPEILSISYRLDSMPSTTLFPVTGEFTVRDENETNEGETLLSEADFETEKADSVIEENGNLNVITASGTTSVPTIDEIVALKEENPATKVLKDEPLGNDDSVSSILSRVFGFDEEAPSAKAEGKSERVPAALEKSKEVEIPAEPTQVEERDNELDIRIRVERDPAAVAPIAESKPDQDAPPPTPKLQDQAKADTTAEEEKPNKSNDDLALRQQLQSSIHGLVAFQK